MRVKNQEISDAILKFVNKYFHENRKAPTISEIADGVGVARSTTHRYMQDLSDNGLLDYSRGILSAPESAKMKTAYIAAPLVGSIQCGCPEEEQEYVEEYVSLPVSMFGKGDFYILRAKGDSMVDAGIEEDDLLVERILSRNILSIKKSCAFPFYNSSVSLRLQTKIGWHCCKHFLSATVPICLCFSFPSLDLYT